MRARHPFLPAVVVLLGVLALAGCGDDASTATDKPSTADLETVPAGEGTACEYVTDVQLPVARKVDPPPDEATVVGEVPVVLTTTVGDFGLTLDADAAPCTVNSFLSLAEQGYFDDTTCQRLTTLAESGIAVLQCGDPSGEGTGGPGYTYADETDGSETYTAGTLAMANRGPDTNGSQFFIVYGDSQLSPDYTVFGTVDDATVTAISDLADQGTVDKGGFTAPAEPVDISTVTIG